MRRMLKCKMPGYSLMCPSGMEQHDEHFIITVDTTKAGSANDTFVLPLPAINVYDYYVDWGEGGAEEHFVANTSQTHVYAAPGTYQIKIAGTFPQIFFNDAGDKLKLISIDNWGDIVWGLFNGAFYGCSNMDCAATDSADTSSVTGFQYAFRDCSSLSTLNTSGWDISVTTTFRQCFQNCLALPILDTSGWDTSSVTNFYRAFYNCDILKGSFASLELTSATNVDEMFALSNINEIGTTTNYDATLISFAAQVVTAAMSFHGGNSKYGEGLVDNGTADGTTADKLIDSSQNFLATVTIGDVVYNTTDGTYARVTNVDNNTTLSLDNDIMVNGEVYRIQHSDAAKARASLILDDTWTITDGGYL